MSISSMLAPIFRPQSWPDILLVPFVFKKICPTVFFSFGKWVGLASAFIIFLFLLKDLEKGRLLQVREGMLPFPIDPWQQVLFV